MWQEAECRVCMSELLRQVEAILSRLYTHVPRRASLQRHVAANKVVVERKGGVQMSFQDNAGSPQGYGYSLPLLKLSDAG